MPPLDNLLLIIIYLPLLLLLLIKSAPGSSYGQRRGPIFTESCGGPTLLLR